MRVLENCSMLLLSNCVTFFSRIGIDDEEPFHVVLCCIFKDQVQVGLVFSLALELNVAL
jgi:hypothetical protein